MAKRMLRRSQVEERTGRSRSAIYADMAAGTFPKPVRLSANSVAWIEQEIDDWIEAKIAAREAA